MAIFGETRWEIKWKADYFARNSFEVSPVVGLDKECDTPFHLIGKLKNAAIEQFSPECRK